MKAKGKIRGWLGPEYADSLFIEYYHGINAAMRHTAKMRLEILRARLGRIFYPIRSRNKGWLRDLVFREIERKWEHAQSKKGGDDRYLLIAECSGKWTGMFHGLIVRAWIRDHDGLRQISIREYQRHVQRTRQGEPWPLVLVSFNFDNAQRKVALSYIQAGRLGHGDEYDVVGNDKDAKLVKNSRHGGFIM